MARALARKNEDRRNDHRVCFVIVPSGCRASARRKARNVRGERGMNAKIRRKEMAFSITVVAAARRAITYELGTCDREDLGGCF